jgi:hypothetical protein
MAIKHNRVGAARNDRRRGGYEVIVRGKDGRPRFERVRDLAAYRARVSSIDRSEPQTISIEEIARLLDR